jgi:hypothetical protein
LKTWPKRLLGFLSLALSFSPYCFYLCHVARDSQGKLRKQNKRFCGRYRNKIANVNATYRRTIDMTACNGQAIKKYL